MHVCYVGKYFHNEIFVGENFEDLVEVISRLFNPLDRIFLSIYSFIADCNRIKGRYVYLCRPNFLYNISLENARLLFAFMEMLDLSRK